MDSSGRRGKRRCCGWRSDSMWWHASSSTRSSRRRCANSSLGRPGCKNCVPGGDMTITFMCGCAARPGRPRARTRTHYPPAMAVALSLPGGSPKKRVNPRHRWIVRKSRCLLPVRPFCGNRDEPNSAEPHPLIVIFVPSRDQGGQPIDQECWGGRIIQGFVSSNATENDMATTVAHMTKSELREMIETIIEQKLLELLGDPDEGLPIRKSVRDRLLRQKQAVVGGQRGEPLEDVARRLGLE